MQAIDGNMASHIETLVRPKCRDLYDAVHKEDAIIIDVVFRVWKVLSELALMTSGGSTGKCYRIHK